MLDIKKWMTIVESVHPVVATAPTPKHFERDTTVVLAPNVGGGVGRFVEFTSEGKALIDIKGLIKEYSEGEFAVPERDISNGNNWFNMSVNPDTPGTQRDKPEFRSGDMVKVADVYGTVIGPGFGVFIGYGTTGEDCIILFDGKQIVVPVENIASVLEQDAKNNFDSMDNDGNLSPMSFGSSNVKVVQEPEMDHKDEFSKWMDAVEEALKSEAIVVEDMPPVPSQCGCGSWDCTVCFPEQDEMPGMHGALDGLGGADVSCGPEVRPTCGNATDVHQYGQSITGMDLMGGTSMPPENNVVSGALDYGLEEMPSDIDDMAAMEPMQSPMEESDGTEYPEAAAAIARKQGNFEQLPRSSDGRGIKLGDIIQSTEYRKVGGESPLTHGEDNLDEAPDESDMSEYDTDDPLAARDYYNELATSPGSEQDIMQMEEWVGSILHMQSQGLSKSPTLYDESDFAAMGPEEVKRVYQEVTGNMTEQGMYTMENIDNDVAAMIATLKKYDTMVAEKKVTKVKENGESDKSGSNESDKKNPWEKLGADKKGDVEKSSKTHKGGTVTKTDTGLLHKGTYGSGKDEVKETADPEVLNWMSRFSKLGNIKGYGR
jgi:hypothetical protein